MSATDACFVCEKHRQGAAAQGGVIYEDELVYAGHAHLLGRSETYLGHLMAEPKRHVVGLGSLTNDEAAALGQLVSRLARSLRDVEGAEHVYSFVFGDVVPHLHIQVVPRYPGTPREYWGIRVTDWPEARRGGVEAMTAVCDRVRTSLVHS
jgi:diadenosine tetraphosphate (Ap4A) HIT family hydrolase